MRSRLPIIGLVCLAVAVTVFAGGQAFAQTVPTLKPGDFAAVCGDSITEQKLYSVLIEDYLLMCQPEPNLRAMQAGWGGEVAEGFLHRMGQDVLTLHPSVATTCYGMNDGGYGPLNPDRAKWYRTNQTAVVDTFRKGGVRLIVLGSPGCVDSDTFGGGNRQAAEVYNKTLGELRDIDREIAQAEHVVFADVHDPMMRVMERAKAKYGHAYHVAGTDGVHPWKNGHLVMAYAFLKAMGCDGHIGTITLDLAANTARASRGHRILSCADGKVEVESTRYPFCFYGDPASPDATSGVIEFFPFNDDLNRFWLRVEGCKPDTRYKVTWGKTSKEFTGAQLTSGINLAAEFIDSPFRDAFAKVEAAVAAQQNYETPMTKDWLHNLPARAQSVPAETHELGRVQAGLIDLDADLAAASSAAVVPVKHTIVVQPAG